MRIQLPPRAPWPDDFPDVIVHGDEKVRDAHPSYLAAKSGDAASALRLAMDFLDREKVQLIGDISRRTNAWLLPVVADEALGFNAIPDGMARYLARLTGIPIVDRGTIVQSNKVSHTRAPAFQRIVTPVTFAGDVTANRNYFLVDDHAGFGGTFASLHGHIRLYGGAVVGCTTLTASPNSAKLAVSKLTLDMLYNRFGDEFDDFWKETLGHNIACLTEREAVALCRQQSVDSLQTILAQATTEVRARGI
jgi:hypothetical protein